MKARFKRVHSFLAKELEGKVSVKLTDRIKPNEAYLLRSSQGVVVFCTDSKSEIDPKLSKRLAETIIRNFQMTGTKTAQEAWVLK